MVLDSIEPPETCTEYIRGIFSTITDLTRRKQEDPKYTQQSLIQPFLMKTAGVIDCVARFQPRDYQSGLKWVQLERNDTSSRDPNLPRYEEIYRGSFHRALHP